MKKKKHEEPMAPMGVWKPPSPAERRKMAARDAARVALDTDPDRKREEDAITAAVLDVMNRRSE